MPLYSLFANILDYPTQTNAQPLKDCAAELAHECPEASDALAAFQSAIGGLNLGQLQEHYINAFDLRPDCTPNLGYHLFGDDGRRGLFLAELKGRMEACGISLGSELPDHVSLLLRYMHHVEQERFILIEDCMLPAVTRITGILDSTGNPYQFVLRALLALLQHQHDRVTAEAGSMQA